jgi:hypothetical protein
VVNGGNVQPTRGRQAATGPGAGAGGRPPAASQRRRGDQADHRHAVVHQGDQGGPDRHPADEVLRPVDRIHDPLPGATAGGAELLADHRVPGSGPAQLAADQFLGRPIGISDRGQVRFGLHQQIDRGEPGDRHCVHLVGDHMRQAEIIVITHAPDGTGVWPYPSWSERIRSVSDVNRFGSGHVGVDEPVATGLTDRRVSATSAFG